MVGWPARPQQNNPSPWNISKMFGFFGLFGFFDMARLGPGTGAGPRPGLAQSTRLYQKNQKNKKFERFLIYIPGDWLFCRGLAGQPTIRKTLPKPLQIGVILLIVGRGTGNSRLGPRPGAVPEPGPGLAQGLWPGSNELGSCLPSGVGLPVGF